MYVFLQNKRIHHFRILHLHRNQHIANSLTELLFTRTYIFPRKITIWKTVKIQLSVIFPQKGKTSLDYLLQKIQLKRQNVIEWL